MTSKVGSGLFPLTLLHNMNIQQPLLHATFKSVFFQLFFQEVEGTRAESEQPQDRATPSPGMKEWLPCNTLKDLDLYLLIDCLLAPALIFKMLLISRKLELLTYV